MSDTIAEDMTDKLGPLPVWVWGAIAAAVSIGGYYLYKRAHPTPPPSGAADASGAPDLSGGTSAAVNGLYATSGIPPQAQSVSSSGDINTWITRAATAVSGVTGKSPSDILAALQLWSNGEALTAAQKGYVDQAIGLQGQPPSLPLSVSPVTGGASGGTANWGALQVVNEDSHGSIGLYNPNTGQEAHVDSPAELQYIQSLISGKSPAPVGLTEVNKAQTIGKQIS